MDFRKPSFPLFLPSRLFHSAIPFPSIWKEGWGGEMKIAFENRSPQGPESVAVASPCAIENGPWTFYKFGTQTPWFR
jgi:hypothetical protein